MSNSNDFQAFAVGSGANVETPSVWDVDSVFSLGFQAGILPSIKLNTALRQSTSIAAMIGAFTAAYGPGNVQDNGNIATLLSQFEAALQSYVEIEGVANGTDIGTANAISVTSLSPATTTFASGQRFVITKSAAANTSTMTATIMSVSGAVIWADSTVLASGDWPASTPALVIWDGTAYRILSVMGPSVFARVSAMTGRLLNVRVFNAAGTSTYTPTTGTNRVEVEIQGGGGGGGGSLAVSGANVCVGSPGSGGSWALGEFTSGFSGVTLTVGASGAGGTGAGGSNGGSTSFGALMTAPGGYGGAITLGTAPAFAGGSQSPVATGGSINGSGVCGMTSIALSSTYGFGGQGGAGHWGGGGSIVGTNTNGIAATAPGAGGGGTCGVSSCPNQIGGAGMAGAIIIREYA